VHFFSKKYLTLCSELVKILTSSKDEPLGLIFKEVIKMMELMLTMVVIALVFVAATIVVAMISGGLIKLKESALRRNAENTSPE
jgi:type III secretory pathway component EscU